MHEFIRYFGDRQNNKFDNLIAVSGKRGKGKTTTTIQFLIRLLISGMEKFDLDKNIAYTQKESIKKLIALPEKSGINLDEGIRAFYKRNWNKKDQKELIILMNQIRFKRLTVMVNIPDFFDLDKDLLKHIELWFLVPVRGKIMVFVQDENAFETDPWHLKENQKIIKKYYKRPSDGLERLMEGYRNTKNYIGEFSVPQLPKDMEEKYETMAKEKKLTPEEKGETEEEEKNKYIDRLKKKEEERNRAIYILVKNGINTSMLAEAYELGTRRIWEIVNDQEKKFKYGVVAETTETEEKPIKT